MAAPNDLPAKKAMLAATEAELDNRIRRFEESIADLRQQHERLRREYGDALRAELAKLDGTGPQHIGGILAALERTQQPITVRRIRELAARYIPPTAHRGP